MQWAAAGREIRTTPPLLIVGIGVLILAAWRIIAETNDAVTFQRQVRAAQMSRAFANGYQLREDAGIRGYVGTGSIFLLRAFTESLPRVAPSFVRLHRDVAILKNQKLSSAAVDAEITARRWNETIAQAVLRDWRFSPARLALMVGGEKLMQRFQADNAQLRYGLSEAAAVADEQTQRALRALSSFIIIMVLALVAGSATLLSARSGRESQTRLAVSLQKALLNRSLPKIAGLVLNAVYVPATRDSSVGGDWYDAFDLADGRVMFSIGDVAGHGVLAATVMSQARQAIIAAALHEADPAQILVNATRSIVLQDGQMVTAICGFINPVTCEILYATAGHPPPLLVTAGQAPQYLPHDGIPLGIFSSAAYSSFLVRAKQGAILFLYTDGIIEQERDVIAGQARLLDAVRSAAVLPNPALGAHRYIFNGVKPNDDTAILWNCFFRLPKQYRICRTF